MKVKIKLNIRNNINRNKYFNFCNYFLRLLKKKFRKLSSVLFRGQYARTRLVAAETLLVAQYLKTQHIQFFRKI